MLGTIASVDSLNEMLLNYEEQKDGLGQIIAYRYLGIRYRETRLPSTICRWGSWKMQHSTC